MNNKKKLLIINGAQFGHSSGHYFYCKYLSDEFYIMYICYDRGLNRLTLDGVDVHYVSFRGTKLHRHIRFLFECVRQSIFTKPDILFVTYYIPCFLLALFCTSKKRILDIRTGALNKNRIIRKLVNFGVFFQSLFFSCVIILSESMRKKLLLSIKKSRVVPLGSELIVSGNHDFGEIKLLYVGALDNRNITETIKGIQLFYEINEFKTVALSYRIIGFGTESEIIKIEDSISAYKLSDLVKFEGRKTLEELVPFFGLSNIGVAYVPRTPWYDCQPTTKLFEYMLSGMPVIATGTYENRLIVNDLNGVIINDTPEAFCDGLINIYNRRNLFNSNTIRKSVEAHTWENIVNSNLKPYLLNLLK